MQICCSNLYLQIVVTISCFPLNNESLSTVVQASRTKSKLLIQK